MLKDKTAQTNIRESWQTVRVIEAMITSNLNAGIFSLAPALTGFAQVPESLLLVFGFSTLEDALKELRSEGLFKSKGWGVRALMAGSRSALPWQDFDEVDRIRGRRNDAAHKRKFLPLGQCRADLNVLAGELLAWRILETDFVGHFKIELVPSTLQT